MVWYPCFTTEFLLVTLYKMNTFAAHRPYQSEYAPLWSYPVSLAGLLVIFYAIWTLYSVFLGPFSHVPGPKLAAATRLYELYHINIKNDWFDTLVGLHSEWGKFTTYFRPSSGGCLG